VFVKAESWTGKEGKVQQMAGDIAIGGVH